MSNLSSGTNRAKSSDTDQPCVGVIMGSSSDWETMSEVCTILDLLSVRYEKRVVSAHRMPHAMMTYAETAASRGLKIIIAGAGGAAHLPGMVASITPLPVLGVPIESRALKGIDSLLSIVQMPGGVPVGTMAIGKSGAKNAGLMAVRILALSDTLLAGRLSDYIAKQTADVTATSSML